MPVVLPSTEEAIMFNAMEIFGELRRLGVRLKRKYGTADRFARLLVELYMIVSKPKLKHYAEIKVEVKVGKAIVGILRKGNVATILYVDAYRSLRPKQLLKHYEIRITR